MTRACPQCHRTEEVTPVPAPGIDAMWEFTCDWSSKHDPPMPYVWLDTNDAQGSVGDIGYELDPYYDALRTAFAEGEPWLEYGIVEWRFRARAASLFADLVREHGHRLLNPRTTRGHTASSYLVQSLSRLRMRGELGRMFGPATTPWSGGQKEVSYWALLPEPLKVNALSWSQYAALNDIGDEELLRGPSKPEDRVG